jgi:hypothetical protein
MKKGSLVSVRQIIKQIPAKASVVRQPRRFTARVAGESEKEGF